MRYLIRAILPLCVAVIAVAAFPRDAAAKCMETVGRPVLPGYLLIVDGKIVGEYAMDVQAPLPAAAEIASIKVICRPATTGPTHSPARQAAIFVLTKDGSPPLFKTYLTELVREQQAHHARTGRYAADLAELRFFESRLPVPIEMEVRSTGWSATARLGGTDTVCHVAVGSGEPMGPRRDPGVAGCFRER